MSNLQQFEVLSETELTAINGGGADDLPFFIANIGNGVGSLANAIPMELTGAVNAANKAIQDLLNLLPPLKISF